jgi:hypothetical protein
VLTDVPSRCSSRRRTEDVDVDCFRRTKANFQLCLSFLVWTVAVLELLLLVRLSSVECCVVSLRLETRFAGSGKASEAAITVGYHCAAHSLPPVHVRYSPTEVAKQADLALRLHNLWIGTDANRVCIAQLESTHYVFYSYIFHGSIHLILRFP